MKNVFINIGKAFDHVGVFEITVIGVSYVLIAIPITLLVNKSLEWLDPYEYSYERVMCVSKLNKNTRYVRDLIVEARGFKTSTGIPTSFMISLSNLEDPCGDRYTSHEASGSLTREQFDAVAFLVGDPNAIQEVEDVIKGAEK